MTKDDEVRYRAWSFDFAIKVHANKYASTDKAIEEAKKIERYFLGRPSADVLPITLVSDKKPT